MYLEEIVLSMIVIILLKLTIDTSLEFKWNLLKFRKDKKELLYIRYHLIMVMEHHKIV
jgi:hypothetical protein